VPSGTCWLCWVVDSVVLAALTAPSCGVSRSQLQGWDCPLLGVTGPAAGPGSEQYRGGVGCPLVRWVETFACSLGSGTVVVMLDVPVVTIENLLLARFAEALPDATVTVVGGGVSVLARQQREQPLQFAVVATLLVAGAAGRHVHRLTARLFDPSDAVAMEMCVDVLLDAAGSATCRVPVCFNVSGAFPVDGLWRVALTTGDDLRTVNIEVLGVSR
jgi:hypothetical protein